MARRKTYYGSSLEFKPLNDVDGMLLYLNRKNATPSSWLDQAPNAYNYAQQIITQQPSLGVNKVIYDGSNDIQAKFINNPYNGNTGMIFFSGYHTGQTQYFHATSNTAHNNTHLIFGMDSLGRIILLNKISGFVRNVRSSGSVLNVGDYFHASIRANGVNWTIRLNSVQQTVNVTAGLNQGNWYADCILFGGINSTSVGGVESLTKSYTNCEPNKIILSSQFNHANLTDIEKFMSIPIN